MSSQQQTPVDFMQLFIEQLLDQLGFSELSDEARKPYVVQFTAELERRIGLALEGSLLEADRTDLDALLGTDVTPEQMTAFWRERVPEYDAVVNDTLASFAIDMRQTAASV